MSEGESRRSGEAVSVIVPTAGAKARASQIARAIESIQAQTGVRAIPIVVLNGTRFDPELKRQIASRSDIRYAYQPVGSLPLALKTGRGLVDTEFFAELDDDDELLPTGLDARLAPMRTDPSIDVVVGNGYFQNGTQRALNFNDFDEVRKNPLDALMNRLWLSSCSGLYRTATVGPEYFAEIPPYLEWTYVALRVALTRKLSFVEAPTYVCHVDTAGSLSKSSEFIAGQAAGLRQMLQLDLPPRVRTQLRKKLGASLHHASDCELAKGNYMAAWKMHLRSLCHPGGYQYAAFTRHLLRPRRTGPGPATR